MIDACRRASARSVTAVMPYFGYARADRKTQVRAACAVTKHSVGVCGLLVGAAEGPGGRQLRGRGPDLLHAWDAWGPRGRCATHRLRLCCAQGRESIAAKLTANILTEAGADRVLAVDLHSGQCVGYFDIPVDHVYGDSGARERGAAKRVWWPAGGCADMAAWFEVVGGVGWRGRAPRAAHYVAPRSPSICAPLVLPSMSSCTHPRRRCVLPPPPCSHPGLPRLQAHLHRRPGGGVARRGRRGARAVVCQEAERRTTGHRGQAPQCAQRVRGAAVRCALRGACWCGAPGGGGGASAVLGGNHMFRWPGEQVPVGLRWGLLVAVRR